MVVTEKEWEGLGNCISIHKQTSSRYTSEGSGFAAHCTVIGGLFKD